MASTSCAPAASEFWFVGGGAIAGRQTRIVLVNPDETAAVVDVLIRGPEGLIDAPAGRGLVVKGEDRLVVRLDVLAPGVTATAVQVLARTGRVGASVDDEQQAGLATVGTDWIPQAAAPAHQGLRARASSAATAHACCRSRRRARTTPSSGSG